MKKWSFKSLKLSAFLVLSFALSLFLSIFSSQEVNAFTIGQNANWVATEQVQFTSGNSNPNFSYPTRSVCGNENGAYINRLYVTMPSWTYDTSEYLEYTMLFNNYKFDNGLDVYLSVNLDPSTGTILRLIDYKFENLGNSQAKATFILKVIANFSGVMTLNISNTSATNTFVLSTNECIGSGFVSLYSMPQATGGTGNGQVVDAIGQIRPQLDNINSLQGRQIEEQKATTNAINNQTQQQQQQYEDEKQEEQDREDQGNADSSQMQGMFNFTAFNPFSGLFGLFTGGGGCVAIPTIASMLRSPTSTYCPWFSGTVRSILTPVIGISAMMLIFGFFVRWLNNGSGKELDING